MNSYLDLSLSQQAIWMDCALIGDPAAYNVGTVLHWHGPAEVPALRRATAAVIAAHEALRLRVDSAQPRQWIMPAPGDDALPFELIEAASAEDIPAALRAVAARGFRFGDHALFRVAAVRAPGDCWAVLLAGHHLAMDGFAIARVRDDWIAACNGAALAQGAAFTDVIAGDAVWPDSEEAEAQRRHWAARLGTLPEPLFARLPLAEAAPAPGRITLSPERYAAFALAARGAGTTAHRALAVLTGIALARRLRRDDVLVGMALHGRPGDQLDCVGQFATLLPVRCQIAKGQTLADAVRANAQALDTDMRHQRLPLHAIARQAGAGTAERVRLIEAAITILPPSRLPEGGIGGAPVTVEPPPGREISPLTAHMRETVAGGLEIVLGGSPDFLTTGETARMADRLGAALDVFIDRPTARASALGSLARGEEATLAGFGAGRRVEPAFPVPLDAFRQHVAAAPAAWAVIDGAREVDYAELDRLSRRFGANLAARGVGQGDVVAVIIDRSLETIAALLGILRLGAVYLPIDPAQPEDRARLVLDQAAPRLVLCNPLWQERLGGTFAVIALAELGNTASPPVDDVAAAPGDPAYIIFTSGSTGVPKGVAVPHRALANLDVARQDHDPIGPGDRILAGISVGFDVSLGQLLLPLMRGAAIVVAPDLRLLSPAAFWRLLTDNRVSHINSVPSFFDAMLDGAPADARLSRLMLGGERLTAPLAARLRQRLNGTQIVNMYGPTEACIDASAFVVPADLAGEAADLPIGRPLPNYVFHVLDAQMMPVGVGQQGELYIGGPGLAIGYLGALQLTAERFVDSDYGRIYRTGDHAAWREDGQLLFLGRIDGQVKIRGHRIETGEIEAALLACDDVAQAAVIARPDPRGDARLLAYVVGKEGAEPDLAALGTSLSRALPHYMQPAAIVAIPALPLTTNGKLDLRALPDPAETGDTPGRAPEGEAEALVARLFAELLGQSAVHATDDFFRLGGHSLLATRLVARLREERGTEIAVRTVYESPTVAALAARLDESTASARAPLTARSRAANALLPLTFAQERLWFLDRLEPGSAAYNIPLVTRLRGDLDLPALQAALDTVVGRHEALRTGFTAQADGTSAQHVADDVRVCIDTRDLRRASAGEVQAAAATAALAPFDLTRPPLLRMSVLQTGADEHLVVLCVHHIVADGWSMAVLLGELGEAYAALRRGLEPPLPPLALQYGDFALWQREQLDGAALDAALGRWQTLLAGAPHLLALPEPAAPEADGSAALTLPPELIRAVDALAASQGCSRFAVLLAGWGLLLGKLAGQGDVLVGTALAGRNDSALDGQIGFYVNSLPVRVTPAAAPSAADLVKATAAFLLDVHELQDMPLDRLVQALAPARTAGRAPLFQTMFVLQNGPEPRLALDGLVLEPVPLGAAPARFDLAISLAEQPAADGPALAGDVVWRGAIVSRETATLLIARYADLLTEICAAPGNTPASFAALADLGQDWTAGEWQAPAPVHPAAAAAPPHGKLETHMAQLWSDLLGTAVTDRTANFFEIGGHSLAALRLIAQLESELQRPVPVAALFECQTLAGFCARLAESETAAGEGSIITTLREGTGTPLFCIHPVGGSAFVYAPLALALPGNDPVLGISADGLVNDAALPADLDAMAARYLAAMREVQPRGPYRLLGHSFGGLVAWRVATMIEDSGEAVAELILLDTEFPGLEQDRDGSAFLTGLPERARRVAENNVRVAGVEVPARRVSRLAYLRADGDGRDRVREARWLALADAPLALDPVSSGHYAMLEGDALAPLIKSLRQALVNFGFTKVS